MSRAAAAMTATLCVLLAGCTVGPNYHRPIVQTPPAWKTSTASVPEATGAIKPETKAPGTWQTAHPQDSLAKGAWWNVFGDPDLDHYEQQLLAANQSLSAAQERVEEARAAAAVSASGRYPQLSVDPDAQRTRISGNRAVVSTITPNRAITQNSFSIPFALSYEVDLFGRVRRTVESANASLQASAADLQNVQLVLTAELAADYFMVHEQDAEAEVLKQSVEAQQRAMDLLNRRHAGGVASGLEVAEQAALLDATRSQLDLIQSQRGQYEHAMAVLTGTPASSFSVPVRLLEAQPPAIPLGLPSDLLERRPDIAVAERKMAAANANIGIAQAAFYPHITLSGSGGTLSRDIGSLLAGPSGVWGVGADALEPIFTGGRNRAGLAAARASYNESVANYRELVLTSFQQVEDSLSGLAALNQAISGQRAAVADSRHALDIAQTRYTGGITTYLDVVTAESNVLTNQRLLTQLSSQQMVTAVYLVKALGGGWDAASLNQPSPPAASSTAHR